MNYIINKLSKLHQACRRGMLELDVLLGNYLKDVYPGLSIDDKKLFVELLDYSDPELFAWLLGHQVPENRGLAKITEAIRCHARSRI